MLTPISNKQELLNAQNKLIKSLEQYEDFHKKVVVTYPSGYFKPVVSYSEKLNIWWVKGIRKDKYKYYNTFGINEPSEKYGNNITVEINCKLSGIARINAGLWARDAKDNVWFLHSGRIGGGKTGIGKSSFWDLYEGQKTEVDFDYDKFPYAVVGNLNDKKLPEKIAKFVKKVAEIKNIITSKGNAEKKIIHKYSPEYTGTRHYGLQEKGTADVWHGTIVNELRKVLLNQFRIETANNRYIDLYTVKTKDVKRINFEIKSGLSRQNVYTAIGQLLLNSCHDKANPQLTFVCPAEIKPEIETDLKKFNINVLKYRWRKNTPVFTNLKSII